MVYPKHHMPHRAFLMPGALICCDLAIITGIFAACIYLRHISGGSFSLESYWAQWPFVILYLIIIASFGGYNILASPPQELRSCTLATLLILAILSSIAFWMRFPFSYSRAILLSAAALLLLAIPIMHYTAKSFFSKFNWWGYKTTLYIFEKCDKAYLARILSRLDPCLKPQVFLRHKPDSFPENSVQGIPVHTGFPSLQSNHERSGGVFIFLGYPQIGSGARAVLAEAEQGYSKTIILHESLNFGNQWAKTIDMGQLVGLEVMQRLLDPKRKATKNIADFLFSCALLVLLSPVFALIALLIQINNPGPVFYRHTRLGLGGTPFRAWKFRTMVRNADTALQSLLTKSPALKTQWDLHHKLPQDPRITSIGRFLRRTSLDELPQLFNVLAGEMSLIGPRPIVQAEVMKYADKYKMIAKVRPGMTGLWQVSGRSRLTYAERVELDVYYIKNWSFWLDMYILLKTPLAVLKFSDAA